MTATTTRSSWPTPLATAAARSRAVAVWVYIFQLPATPFLRVMVPGPQRGRPVSHLPAQQGGQLADLPHQGGVLRRQQRLWPVGQGLLRAAMHLHVDPVGTG